MIKYIAIVIIAFLATTVFWKEKNINNLNIEIDHLKDTLLIYTFKSNYDGKKFILDSFHEPLTLNTNDSVYEIHRIFFATSHKLYIVKVECLIDSTYKIIFKKGSICNPVTKHGICKLEKESTNKLDKSKWLEFKNKLIKTDIYDLTFWITYCFGTDVFLEWQAKIGYQTYTFKDGDGFHDQFSKACAYLLNQVPDEELHKMVTRL